MNFPLEIQFAAWAGVAIGLAIILVFWEGVKVELSRRNFRMAFFASLCLLVGLTLTAGSIFILIESDIPDVGIMELVYGARFVLIGCLGVLAGTVAGVYISKNWPEWIHTEHTIDYLMADLAAFCSLTIIIQGIVRELTVMGLLEILALYAIYGVNCAISMVVVHFGSRKNVD